MPGRSTANATLPLKDRNELFIDELRDVLSAEKQLVKALPKMAKAASSADLRRGFEKHLPKTPFMRKRLHSLLCQTQRIGKCHLVGQ